MPMPPIGQPDREEGRSRTKKFIARPGPILDPRQMILLVHIEKNNDHAASVIENVYTL